MLRILLSSACLALLAAPAAAMADNVETPSKADKLVCKRTQGTGWRLSNGSQVCKTRAEWAAIGDETRKEYRDYGRTGSQGCIACLRDAEVGQRQPRQ
jgi:hypothetical protein